MIIPGMNGRELAERFSAVRPETLVFKVRETLDERVLRADV